MIDLPTDRDISLALSIALFGVVVVGVLVSRRLNGSATPPLKYGLAALLTMAALRLYSASSYLWGSTAQDLGIFPFLRFGVIALLTLALILSLALVAFYARRLPPKHH